MTRAEIGRELQQLREAVIEEALGLVAQYRAVPGPTVGKQILLEDALDTAHAARDWLATWQADYDARHGPGTASVFLGVCLASVGLPTTVAAIDAELATLEATAQAIADDLIARAIGPDAAAAALEAALATETREVMLYRRRRVRRGYTTIFGRTKGPIT